MFYVLIVYENGTVQTVHPATLIEAEAMIGATRDVGGATFVQWGAWPFGPAFGTEIIERLLLEPETDEDRGDIVGLFD